MRAPFSFTLVVGKLLHTRGIVDDYVVVAVVVVLLLFVCLISSSHHISWASKATCIKQDLKSFKSCERTLRDFSKILRQISSYSAYW